MLHKLNKPDYLDPGFVDISIKARISQNSDSKDIVQFYFSQNFCISEGTWFLGTILASGKIPVYEHANFSFF